MKLGIVLLALSIFVGAASRLEFEVATVKLSKAGDGVSGGCHGIDSTYRANDLGPPIPLGRCVITAGRLDHLVSIAYRIQYGLQKLAGAPGWPDRFDIQGKAEHESATEEQLLEMLQNLLADRFQLKLHRETRQVSGYALVIAKSGTKLKTSNSEGRESLRMAGAAIFKRDAIQRNNLEQNSIIAEHVSMSRLAHVLANLPASDPVIDKTGLSAKYDFKLTWEPSESLSSALQDQLGLRLEAEKVPVEFLVIDSVTKPREN